MGNVSSLGQGLLWILRAYFGLTFFLDDKLKI